MLMMVALVLVIMMAAQFALSNALNTREIQMSELALQLQKLNDALNLEKSTSESLRGQKSQLEARVKQVEDEAAKVRNRLTESEGRLGGLIGERDSAKREMERAFQEATAMKVQLSDMVRQIEELNKKLALLTADLAGTYPRTVSAGLGIDPAVADADLARVLRLWGLERQELHRRTRALWAAGYRPGLPVAAEAVGSGFDTAAADGA
jgi:uncharacterized protein YhaN